MRTQSASQFFVSVACALGPPAMISFSAFRITFEEPSLASWFLFAKKANLKLQRWVHCSQLVRDWNLSKQSPQARGGKTLLVIVRLVL